MESSLEERIEEILLDPGNHAGFFNGVEDTYSGLKLRVRLTSDVLRRNLNMPCLKKDIAALCRQYAVEELEKVKKQANVSGFSSGMYDTLDEKTRKVWFEASKQRQEDNDYWIDQAIARLKEGK